MPPILHRHLPVDLALARQLPGIRPIEPADWLMVDECYADQMALRCQLIAKRRDEVIALMPEGLRAALELLEFLLDHLGQRDDYQRGPGELRCPDGRVVAIDPGDPLGTAGQLVQEDLCILVKDGPQHRLFGAVLCFPASWRLGQKIGRPLTSIHTPVAEYDDLLARRVQRLFDGIRNGQYLRRYNALGYDDPSLFHPRPESDPRPIETLQTANYLRCERQVITRLPQTGAAVFSIHSFVVNAKDAPGWGAS